MGSLRAVMAFAHWVDEKGRNAAANRSDWQREFELMTAVRADEVIE